MIMEACNSHEIHVGKKKKKLKLCRKEKKGLHETKNMRKGNVDVFCYFAYSTQSSMDTEYITINSSNKGKLQTHWC